MVTDDTHSSEHVLVRVGSHLDMAELERLRTALRTHAVVTLDFALARHFDDAVLEALARAISTNMPRVVLRGLSAHHYATLRRTGFAS